MGLMISAGASGTAREELTNDVPTVYPRDVTLKRGSHWKPMGHKDVADGTIQALETAGYTVKEESWATSAKARTGPDAGLSMGLIGVMRVEHPDMIAPIGTSYSFAVRHANNMSRALSVIAGLNIFVCSNGMFVGDSVVNRKHTDSVDLPTLLDSAVDSWATVASGAEDIIDRFKAYDLSGPIGAREGIDILSQMVSPRKVGKEPVFPGKYLGEIIEEYKYPRHEEWKDPSLFSLGQAVTEICKARRISGQLETLERLVKFQNTVVGHAVGLN